MPGEQTTFRTWASQLLTVGVPVIEISQQLGHRQVSTTLDHYSKYIDRGKAGHKHLERREGEVAADLLARLLEQSDVGVVAKQNGNLGTPVGTPSALEPSDEEQTAALH